MNTVALLPDLLIFYIFDDIFIYQGGSMDTKYNVYPSRIQSFHYYVNKIKNIATCNQIHYGIFSLNMMCIFCLGNNIGKKFKIELGVLYQLIPV